MLLQFLIVLSSLNDNEVDLVEQKLSALRDALDLPYYVIHLAAVFGDINIDDSGRCIGLQQVSCPIFFVMVDQFHSGGAHEMKHLLSRTPGIKSSFEFHLGLSGFSPLWIRRIATKQSGKNVALFCSSSE